MAVRTLAYIGLGISLIVGMLLILYGMVLSTPTVANGLFLHRQAQYWMTAGGGALLLTMLITIILVAFYYGW